MKYTKKQKQIGIATKFIFKIFILRFSALFGVCLFRPIGIFLLFKNQKVEYSLYSEQQTPRCSECLYFASLPDIFINDFLLRKTRKKKDNIFKLYYNYLVFSLYV